MSTFLPRHEVSERIAFENSRGLRLAGLLERPRAAPRLFALVAHCFTCSKDFPAIVHLSRALAARGIAALRFDLTGLGTSAGSFADTNFTTALDDIASAARYLSEHEASPSLIVGHSWGGAAALAVAGDLPDVRAVATIAAPSSPAHVLEHFPREVESALASGSASMAIAGRSHPLTRQFVEDVRGTDFGGRLERLDRAVLVLHSPDDAVVPIAHAERLYKAVRGPRSFVALPGADHVLSKRRDTDYAAAMISTWVARYTEPWVASVGVLGVLNPLQATTLG